MTQRKSLGLMTRFLIVLCIWVNEEKKEVTFAFISTRMERCVNIPSQHQLCFVIIFLWNINFAATRSRRFWSCCSSRGNSSSPIAMSTTANCAKSLLLSAIPRVKLNLDITFSTSLDYQTATVRHVIQVYLVIFRKSDQWLTNFHPKRFAMHSGTVGQISTRKIFTLPEETKPKLQFFYSSSCIILFSNVSTQCSFWKKK